MATETQEIEFRLEWQKVCAVAVKAHCLGLSFEEVVRLALEQYVKDNDPA